MKDKFLKQAEREYRPGIRGIGLIIEGIVFLGLLPGTLVYFSPRLDYLLKLPHITSSLINVVLGCGIIIMGILFAWWAIYVQFTIGRGTPVPLMATQQLIVTKPYNYCRNPMALGSIMAYLGVALLIISISALVLVLAWTVLLLTYIKLLEEKEMELRFGQAYQKYRKQTSFILPRFR